MAVLDETPTGVFNDGCVDEAPGTSAASDVKLRPFIERASTCVPFTTWPTVAFSDCSCTASAVTSMASRTVLTSS